MCKNYSFILCLTVSTLSVSVHSARILAVFPTPSLSHQVVFHALIKALAKNGHHITLVTPDPVEPSVDYQNMTQINLHDITYKLFLENLDVTNVGFTSNGDFTAILSQFYRTMVQVVDGQFRSSAVRKLIKYPDVHQFDLFIGEYLTPEVFAFADLYKIPSIGVNSFQQFEFQFEMMGNPTHPCLYSHAFSTGIGFAMTFLEKLSIFYYSLKVDFLLRFEHFIKKENLVKKHFPLRHVNMGKLMKSVDMVFVNSDSVFSGARPNVPQIVFLGNMHFKDELALPEDLQSYMDASKDGVIYMSLGTNIKSNRLPEDRRRVFLETFRDLPYDILWKWEDEILPGRPNNVRIAKWLPQSDILRHPNVKLFITQSGLQSTEEAIKYNVPMIGIPFVVDQFFISKQLEQFGIGVKLNIMTVTTEQLKTAIIQIMENKIYVENIAKLSKIIYDQPMKPIERAVWWTEYVVRNKRTLHLRSPLPDVSFYEYYMLDVLLFLFVGFLTPMIIIYYIVKFSLRKLCFSLIKNKRRK